MKAGDFEAVAKAGYKRAPRGKGLTLGNLGFIDEYFTFSDTIDWLLTRFQFNPSIVFRKTQFLLCSAHIDTVRKYMYTFGRIGEKKTCIKVNKVEKPVSNKILNEKVI